MYRVRRSGELSERRLCVGAAHLQYDARTAAQLGDHQRVLEHDAAVHGQELGRVHLVQRQLRQRRYLQPAVYDLPQYAAGDAYGTSQSYRRKGREGKSIYIAPLLSLIHI